MWDVQRSGETCPNSNANASILNSNWLRMEKIAYQFIHATDQTNAKEYVTRKEVDSSVAALLIISFKKMDLVNRVSKAIPYFGFKF